MNDNTHTPMTTTAATQQIDMDTMKLGPRHIGIMLVAALGQLVGQGLATLVGIVIPLMQIAMHPELSASMQGLMGCVSLIGIMLGTVVFGRLSDRFGYLFFFRLCPLIIVVSSLTAAFFPHVAVIVPALFLMGFAIGGEYSLDPDYISELMPAKWRLFMVGVAKALASAGSAIVAIVCYLLITHWESAAHWPSLFLIVTAIAVLMFVSRLGFVQSPAWLMEHGRDAQAQKAVKHFLGQNVYMPEQTEKKATVAAAKPESMWAFIKRNPAKIVLTGIPWACEGLGVYGIGIFLPILIMSFHLDQLPADATHIQHITNSVGLTFVLSVVMMIGFFAGLMMLRRFNHLRMQTVGFVMSGAGLGLLLAAYLLEWPSWIAITGFIVFELFLNAGPHLITFILPTNTYPVDERGTGSGIAAGIGKTGAVLGAFIIPVLLRSGGATLVLIVSIAVMFVGALVTVFSARAASKE